MSDDILFPLIFIGALILVALLIIVPPAWYASCRTAATYNKVTGTQLTCGDVFWLTSDLPSKTIRLEEAK